MALTAGKLETAIDHSVPRRLTATFRSGVSRSSSRAPALGLEETGALGAAGPGAEGKVAAVAGGQAMRGREDRSESLFSYVRLEERVPADHPLRAIRALADEVLGGLNGRFETLYSQRGRPSIPPEMLVRATLLQAFFSVRSERMLMEQIDYNLLFR